MTDCRCAICGTCKHDHGGWEHKWKEGVEIVYIDSDGVAWCRDCCDSGCWSLETTCGCRCHLT